MQTLGTLNEKTGERESEWIYTIWEEKALEHDLEISIVEKWRNDDETSSTHFVLNDINCNF